MRFLSILGWLSYFMISPYGDGEKEVERKRQKNLAKHSGQPYYWHDGQPYDIINDMPCIPSQKLINGEWRTVLLYDKDQYRDITEEIRRIKDDRIAKVKRSRNEDDLVQILTTEYHQRIGECKNSVQLYTAFFLLFEAITAFIGWQSKDWNLWGILLVALVLINVVFLIYKINQIALIKKQYKNKGVQV